MNDFFETEVFSFFNQSFTIGNLAFTSLTFLAIFFVYRIIKKKILPFYYDRCNVSVLNQKQVHRFVKYISYILLLLSILLGLQLDYLLYKQSESEFAIKVSTLLSALLIIQFARLFDYVLVTALVNYYRARDKEKKKEVASTSKKGKQLIGYRTVQAVVYVIASILILQNLQLDYTLFKIPNGDTFHHFKISKVFFAALIILLTRLFVWILTQLILYTYYRKNKINAGTQYAINQLISYVIYIAGIFIVLDYIGVHMTVIWGGAAALLVGVGLGLQQTFNDFFSGLILLFERSIEVEDIIEASGLVGTVKQIGLRASIVKARGGLTVVVPNSKLVTNNVTNWSHSDDKVLFKLEVRVAYGTDTAFVKELLLEISAQNSEVLANPAPKVHLSDFGENALIFKLLFWSKVLLTPGDVKSDLRFAIDDVFRENNIIIPVPQREVLVKKETYATAM